MCLQSTLSSIAHQARHFHTRSVTLSRVRGARCAVRSAAVRLHAVVDATHLGGGRVAQGMHNCGGEGGGGRKGWEGGRGEVGGGGKGARTRITSGGDPPRSSQRSRSGSTALECSMS